MTNELAILLILKLTGWPAVVIALAWALRPKKSLVLSPAARQQMYREPEPGALGAWQR